MVDQWDICFAIVSDLHCHEETFQPPESWLIAGARRKPPGNHPVQALISLIRETSIRADALICPGDLANRISSAGMMQSWDHLRELQTELHAALLLATLGNHDVDCHKTHNTDPFYIPRNLHQNFPTATDADSANFWANGFYFVGGPNGSDFLILNTVIGHTDEVTAKRGTFDHERIKQLGIALDERENNYYKSRDVPYRIAVMHHHPLLHSSTRFSSADVLEFGDQLLSVLSQHGFRFIVHGHRHDPRITRQASGLSDYFVFAAGSFSAILKELSTWTRNLFHVVKLRRDLATGRLIGELLSWEYHKGLGWRKSTTVSAALPHVARFCSPRPDLELQSIKRRCETATGSLLRASDLNTAFPDLALLLPGELTNVGEALSKIGVKLVQTPEGTVDYLGLPERESL
jgi:3',5'-cyclic AMP phosphodiesterase CpdA